MRRTAARAVLVLALAAGLLATQPPAQADLIGVCPSGWARVASPARPIPAREELNDVVAHADGAVWAVGEGGNQALVEYWNGFEWQRRDLPTLPSPSSLYRIDASGPSDLWAVGHADYDPLLLRSNGNAWTQVPQPPNGTVVDVAALSPTDVWAVGELGDEELPVAGIFHWDGASWTTVTHQAPPNGILSMVEASSPDNVWAAGTHYDGSFYTPYVERWDGVSWTRVPIPSGSGVLGSSSGFGSMSTSGPNDLWLTVQETNSFPEHNGPYSVHFDGSTWRRDRIGQPHDRSYVKGIVSTGSNVWAVGGYSSSYVGNAPATFHWSGTQWTTEPAPPLPLSGDQDAELNAVTTAANGAVWAVGASQLSTYTARRCDGPNGPVADPVTRVAGTDRIATAIAASTLNAAGSAQAVVLSRSDGFADALAGTPLAVKKGGPLLLTPSGSALDPRVLTEIRRVLPAGRTVYVLGGPSALHPAVDTALNNAGYLVFRLQGQTRYGTAVSIADLGLGNPPLQLLATGLGFADALAGGAAASTGVQGGAVLLTHGNELPSETAAYLANHAGARFALGGPAAGVTGVGATPIVGADRYETAALVAERFFTDPAGAVLAYGQNFPDALAGGALAGRGGVPLLLTRTADLPASVDAYIAQHRAAMWNGFVVGGPAVISDAVLAAFRRTMS
ncbi:MAG: cell wall-binding repeat-containing protein [Actinomycetota bacterium]|nr:cell wall-binding repeat-containing protein [Actinomycetota bacterium]